MTRPLLLSLVPVALWFTACAEDGDDGSNAAGRLPIRSLEAIVQGGADVFGGERFSGWGAYDITVLTDEGQMAAVEVELFQTVNAPDFHITLSAAQDLDRAALRATPDDPDAPPPPWIPLTDDTPDQPSGSVPLID